MAFDYVLNFPCEVRSNVPEEKLITLVGHMSLAQFAVEEIRRSNPAVPMEVILDKCEVHVSQLRPDGATEQVPMTVGQLVALAQPLSQYKQHCPDCRANISDRSFGCIAKINYPIKKEVEEWLLSRLPSDVNDPDLSLLFKFLVALKIDGQSVDAMRGRLVESQKPFVRSWECENGRQQITSSQILKVLVFGGNIGSDRARIYTKLFRLNSVLSDPHLPSSNIEQFKTLMCAIVMSGRLNAGISTDA